MNTGMVKEQFKIGIPFWTATGKWVCTDVGTRIIVAVKEGGTLEEVFDDFGGCSMEPFNKVIDMNEYLEAICKAYHPELRKGQTLFNTLYKLHPKLANEIRATNLDPFYSNKRIPAFWKWLETK